MTRCYWSCWHCNHSYRWLHWSKCCHTALNGTRKKKLLLQRSSEIIFYKYSFDGTSTSALRHGPGLHAGLFRDGQCVIRRARGTGAGGAISSQQTFYIVQLCPCKIRPLSSLYSTDYQLLKSSMPRPNQSKHESS